MLILHALADHVRLLVTEHVVQMVVLVEGVQDASVIMLAPSLVTAAMILRIYVQLVSVQ